MSSNGEAGLRRPQRFKATPDLAERPSEDLSAPSPPPLVPASNGATTRTTPLHPPATTQCVPSVTSSHHHSSSSSSHWAENGAAPHPPLTPSATSSPTPTTTTAQSPIPPLTVTAVEVPQPGSPPGPQQPTILVARVQSLHAVSSKGNFARAAIGHALKEVAGAVRSISGAATTTTPSTTARGGADGTRPSGGRVVSTPVACSSSRPLLSSSRASGDRVAADADDGEDSLTVSVSRRSSTLPRDGAAASGGGPRATPNNARPSAPPPPTPPAAVSAVAGGSGVNDEATHASGGGFRRRHQQQPPPLLLDMVTATTATSETGVNQKPKASFGAGPGAAPPLGVPSPPLPTAQAPPSQSTAHTPVSSPPAPRPCSAHTPPRTTPSPAVPHRDTNASASIKTPPLSRPESPSVLGGAPSASTCSRGGKETGAPGGAGAGGGAADSTCSVSQGSSIGVPRGSAGHVRAPSTEPSGGITVTASGNRLITVRTASDAGRGPAVIALERESPDGGSSQPPQETSSALGSEYEQAKRRLQQYGLRDTVNTTITTAPSTTPSNSSAGVRPAPQTLMQLATPLRYATVDDRRSTPLLPQQQQPSQRQSRSPSQRSSRGEKPFVAEDSTGVTGKALRLTEGGGATSNSQSLRSAVLQMPVSPGSLRSGSFSSSLRLSGSLPRSSPPPGQRPRAVNVTPVKMEERVDMVTEQPELPQLRGFYTASMSPDEAAMRAGVRRTVAQAGHITAAPPQQQQEPLQTQPQLLPPPSEAAPHEGEPTTDGQPGTLQPSSSVVTDSSHALLEDETSTTVSQPSPSSVFPPCDDTSPPRDSSRSRRSAAATENASRTSLSSSATTRAVSGGFDRRRIPLPPPAVTPTSSSLPPGTPLSPSGTTPAGGVSRSRNVSPTSTVPVVSPPRAMLFPQDAPGRSPPQSEKVPLPPGTAEVSPVLMSSSPTTATPVPQQRLLPPPPPVIGSGAPLAAASSTSPSSHSSPKRHAGVVPAPPPTTPLGSPSTSSPPSIVAGVAAAATTPSKEARAVGTDSKPPNKPASGSSPSTGTSVLSQGAPPPPSSKLPVLPFAGRQPALPPTTTTTTAPESGKATTTTTTTAQSATPIITVPASTVVGKGTGPSGEGRRQPKKSRPPAAHRVHQGSVPFLPNVPSAQEQVDDVPAGVGRIRHRAPAVRTASTHQIGGEVTPFLSPHLQPSIMHARIPAMSSQQLRESLASGGGPGFRDSLSGQMLPLPELNEDDGMSSPVMTPSAMLMDPLQGSLPVVRLGANSGGGVNMAGNHTVLPLAQFTRQSGVGRYGLPSPTAAAYGVNGSSISPAGSVRRLASQSGSASPSGESLTVMEPSLSVSPWPNIAPGLSGVVTGGGGGHPPSHTQSRARLGRGTSNVKTGLDTTFYGSPASAKRMGSMTSFTSSHRGGVSSTRGGGGNVTNRTSSTTLRTGALTPTTRISHSEMSTLTFSNAPRLCSLSGSTDSSSCL